MDFTKEETFESLQRLKEKHKNAKSELEKYIISLSIKEYEYYIIAISILEEIKFK